MRANEVAVSPPSLTALAALSARIRAERGRKAKIEAIAAALSEARDHAPLMVSWLTGELPQGRIGLGWASVRKALDAVASDAAAAEPALAIDVIDAAFTELATVSGPGSNTQRGVVLAALFARVAAPEREFLAHLLMGEMRHGAQSGVVLAAVAMAFAIPEADVRRATMLVGSLPEITRRASLSEGLGGDALAGIGLEVFVPVAPMLAGTADRVADLFDLAGLLLEVKLDGARVQAHVRGGVVKVYSRALNEVTPAVPEVVALLAGRIDDAIIEGEVIALRSDGRPHAFQTTMRRFGRKSDDAELRAALPLSTFWFDALRLGGVDLIDQPLSERRARLAAVLPDHLTNARRVTTHEEADAYLQAILAAGHEGLMAKRLDSAYSAGQRGSAWLKLKPAKTLDLVVIAVERGSGRRAQWLSNLHLAARDVRDDGVHWVMLGKTFKGMTDALLEWQTRELGAREVHREGYVVHVRPELVVEIAFQELETSPRYPGGLALRFARVRGYRPDKRPEDADTIATVHRLYEAQRHP